MFKKKTINVKRNEFVAIKSKQNVMARKLSEIESSLVLLAKVNFNLQKRDLQIILMVLFGAGIILGVLLKNTYIAVMLCIALPVIFLEWLNIKKDNIANYIDSQVIKYAELIKNSYMTTNNLKASIEGNIRRFEEPLKSIFTDFLEEVDIYNYPMDEALGRMNQKIESKSLKEFTEQLALCDKDRRFINSLQATVRYLSDKRLFMQKWDFIKKDIMQKYVTMLVICNGMTLFMIFGFTDISALFLGSSFSKPIIALNILIQILVTLKTMRTINNVKV